MQVTIKKGSGNTEAVTGWGERDGLVVTPSDWDWPDEGVRFVITHMESGYFLPWDTENRLFAVKVVEELAEGHIDWEQPQSVLLDRWGAMEMKAELDRARKVAAEKWSNQ